MLDALNVLGRTAWVINEPILRVMEEVWETGGGRADVPPRKNKDDPEWPSAPFGLRFGAGRNQLLATALPSRHEVWTARAVVHFTSHMCHTHVSHNTSHDTSHNTSHDTCHTRVTYVSHTSHTHI